MAFTVLSDSDVKNILSTLDRDNTKNALKALQHALIAYSCGTEKTHQPHRSVVNRAGQVSLFMPATTQHLVGVKTVGVSPSTDPKSLPPGTTPPPGLKSALTLCDATGQVIGILNAAELTAFRTALGAMLVFQMRKNVGNIIVFGAGKQAVWHVLLAVRLRGGDIRRVTVVNRSEARLRDLITRCKSESAAGWPSNIEIEAFEGGEKDGAAMENLIADADVVFCTTPSTTPLFPASFLLSERALRKTRLISAIGSYRLDMQEIDPHFLMKIADPSSELAATSFRGGIITVDSREGCLQEAGELVAAKIDPEKMVEVGQLFNELDLSDSQDLRKWLESGLVVYKSVGVGVMDLAVGRYLLEFAQTRNIGLSVDDF